MLFANRRNTVKHHGDDAQYDGNDQDDVKKFATWSVGFEYDFVQTQPPGCRFAVAFRVWFREPVRIGSCAHDACISEFGKTSEPC